MTLSEFDSAVEAAMASGDPTALEKLLAVAERNVARTEIRCADHRRYRGLSQPRGGCPVCWKIYAGAQWEVEGR